MVLIEAREYLKKYDGRELRLMEVCGTQTAGIRQNGILSMLSNKIHMITGPGCPVCVTVTDYIDRLIRLAEDPVNVIMCFGDMLRVPGSAGSLYDAKAHGADVRFVYSPLDMIGPAKADREHVYIFCAVGFETTAPVYAALLAQAEEEGIRNIRLLTSLKTMPRAITQVSEGIDGFLAPGHVAVITGAGEYRRLAEKTGIPFVVSGFQGEELIASIYALVRLAERKKGGFLNLYPQAVSEEGNEKAGEAVRHYFEKDDAGWRGMGVIPDSGLYLRKEFSGYDAGSRSLINDREAEGCRCADIITGKIRPGECPLFCKACTPKHPIGACMVSQEGACYNEAL